MLPIASPPFFPGPLPDPDHPPPLPDRLPVGMSLKELQIELIARLKRLDGPGDLSDLSPELLDGLADGWLAGLAGKPFSPRGRHTTEVRLPAGCAAATVNRFLDELPDLRILRAPRVVAIDRHGQADAVRLDKARNLIRFETTRPRPPLRFGSAPVQVLECFTGAARPQR
jgi:hypothetical protein